MRIDWSVVDKLIIEHLPKMTCVDFCKQHAQFTIPRTIGQRAYKLGILPIKYMPTDEHKKKTGDGIRENFDKNVVDFVRSNANVKSRKQIARELNISLFHVQRIIDECGIIIDVNKTREFCATASRKHVARATQASVERWKDPKFREEMSNRSSESSKRLWLDEMYRVKVLSGIKKTYETTDFRSRLSAINKERYNTDPKVRAILMSDRPFKNSKLNDLVATKLDGFGIKYEREFNLANYKFDFKIDNLLLEVNGDYWHSKPENQKNDLAKATIINTYYPEYRIVVIWERELKSIRANERLLEVLEIKPIIPIEINLNDLTFTDKPKDVEKFLASFHYLGSTNRKKYCFGLSLLEQLVAVAIFGSPIRPKIGPGKVLELTRLCRHPRFFNKNIHSYFLSKCENYIKNLSIYDSLVSFADLRLHDGAVYRAANWIDLGDTAPDYNYMSNENIPMHKKTLYNRAVNENITEREFAEKYEYKKVKIGSKRKFIRYLNKI